MAPPLVCTSIKHDGGEALLHHTQSKPFFDELLSNPDLLLVGHHIAYDLSVVAAKWPELLGSIFQVYEDNRVRDTGVRWKLLDIAMGCYRGYEGRPTKKEIEKAKEEDRKPKGKWVKIRYDLDTSQHRFTRKHLEKDEWRMRYGEFLDVPDVQSWPKGAQHYPMEDARATHLVYKGQEEQVKPAIVKGLKEHYPDIKDPDPLGDEPNQVRAAWWIQLMHCKGIRTDGAKVAKFEEDTRIEQERTRNFVWAQEICSHCGRLFVVKQQGQPKGCPVHGRIYETSTLLRHNGKRNTKAAKLRMEHVMGGKENCRLTDTGNISVDAEACELSGDILLRMYADLTSLSNVLTKDIPALLDGTALPIHSSFDTLLATGRTSSFKPNIQNVRRLPGIRECFVPRKGNVFLCADYDGLELRTLGQVCKKIVGWSKLAEILNEGKDPHTQVAAAIMKISYEEAERRLILEDSEVENARQFAKIANFGFPGGLGYEALILFARRSDKKIEMTIEDAIQLKEDWMLAFPEMELYFDYINTKCNQSRYYDEGLATIEQLFTKRIRGKIRYTVACNTHFQGLGSDATKHAGWLISKACYVDKSSPLYGCYIVNYVHDEFIVECPEERAHEACMELARLMVEGASKYLPDVPPTVKKPLVARCWSKKSRPVWLHGDKKPAGPDDQLIPWDERYLEKAA